MSRTAQTSITLFVEDLQVGVKSQRAFYLHFRVNSSQATYESDDYET